MEGVAVSGFRLSREKVEHSRNTCVHLISWSIDGICSISSVRYSKCNCSRRRLISDGSIRLTAPPLMKEVADGGGCRSPLVPRCRRPICRNAAQRSEGPVQRSCNAALVLCRVAGKGRGSQTPPRRRPAAAAFLDCIRTVLEEQVVSRTGRKPAQRSERSFVREAPATLPTPTDDPHLSAASSATEEAAATIRFKPRHAGSRRHV